MSYVFSILILQDKETYMPEVYTAVSCNFCKVFSKTFQITKTFHVAMLHGVLGFWTARALNYTLANSSPPQEAGRHMAASDGLSNKSA